MNFIPGKLYTNTHKVIDETPGRGAEDGGWANPVLPGEILMFVGHTVYDADRRPSTGKAVEVYETWWLVGDRKIRVTFEENSLMHQSFKEEEEEEEFSAAS